MKLLVIDPDISLSSPAMKGMIRSFPAIRQAGFEIEIWCWDCDAGLQVDRIVKLSSTGAWLLGPFRGIWFGAQVALRSWWLFTVLGRQRADLVYSVLPYLPDCDVAHAHFSSWDWEARMKAMGNHSLRDWLERTANWIGKLWTENFLRRTRASTLIVPSDAVADDFRRVSDHRGIVVLPNSYDAARFNLGVRDRWRDSQRKALGYTAEDRVFLFVSMGHHRRKGFFLAAAAVQQLQAAHPEARLLVVGGRPKTLERLKRWLDAECPGWTEWLHFAGNTSEPEKFMAAADAFLFPSYSEAFALVEVEAAACGLPLFLTHHHGSEMILENGVNGSLIEFDPAHIAKTLSLFLTGEWVQKRPGLKRALNSEAYAAELVRVLRSSVSRTSAADRPLQPQPATSL